MRYAVPRLAARRFRRGRGGLGSRWRGERAATGDGGEPEAGGGCGGAKTWLCTSYPSDSLPDTFFRLNDDMESDRNEEVCIQKVIKKSPSYLE